MHFLADVATSFELTPILQGGVPGVVLAWFMLRNEKNMTNVQASVDNMSRSILLLIISRSNDPQVNRQAEQILASLPDGVKK